MLCNIRIMDAGEGDTSIVTVTQTGDTDAVAITETANIEYRTHTIVLC